MTAPMPLRLLFKLFPLPFTLVARFIALRASSSRGCNSTLWRMLVEVLLYVHRNRRFIRDGIRDGEPRTSTSTFTQLLSSDVSCDAI